MPPPRWRSPPRPPASGPRSARAASSRNGHFLQDLYSMRGVDDLPVRTRVDLLDRPQVALLVGGRCLVALVDHDPANVVDVGEDRDVFPRRQITGELVASSHGRIGGDDL